MDEGVGVCLYTEYAVSRMGRGHGKSFPTQPIYRPQDPARNTQ